MCTHIPVYGCNLQEVGCTSILQHLSCWIRDPSPAWSVGSMISQAELGGLRGRRLSGLWLGAGQERDQSLPPLSRLCAPLFLYTKTICFSCSNEEQCLTDKGASSLLLCCLWRELDAGKNGNSQCECFFSSRTGYGWACTLYIADGTIANTVRTRKEWITAFFPPC